MELLIRLVALSACVHFFVHLLNQWKRRQLAQQCKGRIVWIDTETTGLEPGVDEVLEVACIVTDMQGNEVGVPRFHAVLPYTRQGMERLAANDYVLDMHAKSKLLATVRISADIGIPRDFTELETYLNTHAQRAYMAGFSCHFDRAMLMAEGVDLSMLHHRMIDVTSIDLTRQASGLPSIKPRGEVAHRAMQDNLQAIDSYKRALMEM